MTTYNISKIWPCIFAWEWSSDWWHLAGKALQIDIKQSSSSLVNRLDEHCSQVLQGVAISSDRIDAETAHCQQASSSGTPEHSQKKPLPSIRLNSSQPLCIWNTAKQSLECFWSKKRSSKPQRCYPWGLGNEPTSYIGTSDIAAESISPGGIRRMNWSAAAATALEVRRMAMSAECECDHQAGQTAIQEMQNVTARTGSYLSGGPALPSISTLMFTQRPIVTYPDMRFERFCNVSHAILGSF